MVSDIYFLLFIIIIIIVIIIIIWADWLALKKAFTII